MQWRRNKEGFLGVLQTLTEVGTVLRRSSQNAPQKQNQAILERTYSERSHCLCFVSLSLSLSPPLCLPVSLSVDLSVYLSVYLSLSVKSWSKISSFFRFWIFFLLISAGRMRAFKKNRNGQIWPFFKSKTGPTMLRNILGPIFDLCLDQFWILKFDKFGPFVVIAKYAETTICIAFSAKCTFKAHSPKLGPLFVNTTALTEKQIGVFFAFLFFIVFAVFVLFVRLFVLIGMKNKNRTSK